MSTQTVTRQPNRTIFPYSLRAILKAMTDTVLLGLSLGVVRILFNVKGFSNKGEHSVADWLNLLSHILLYTFAYFFIYGHTCV